MTSARQIIYMKAGPNDASSIQRAVLKAALTAIVIN